MPNGAWILGRKVKDAQISHFLIDDHRAGAKVDGTAIVWGNAADNELGEAVREVIDATVWVQTGCHLDAIKNGEIKVTQVLSVDTPIATPSPLTKYHLDYPSSS